MLSTPIPLSYPHSNEINLQQQCALVTGSTNGVGRAFCHWLAARGCEVIATGRNAEKLAALKNELTKHYPDSTIQTFQADHLQLDQIASLSEQLQPLPKLDYLINNAGLCPPKRILSPEGYEAAFTINYLSHMLLTLRLLPTLINSKAYVMNVSSSAMGGGVIRMDDLHGEQGFEGWQAYSNSKLANTLFSNLLAEKLAEDGVRSNAVCPGMVKSDLLTGHPMFAGKEAALYEASKPPEEAADYLGWMIQDDAVNQLSGYFFSKGFYGRRAVTVNWDRDQAQALWQYSSELLQNYLPSS